MGCLLQVVCFIVADKINSTCWSSHLLKAILDRYDLGGNKMKAYKMEFLGIGLKNV
jgi:hypothetical protein